MKYYFLILDIEGNVVKSNAALPSPADRLISKIRDNAEALLYHMGDELKYIEIETDNEILFVVKGSRHTFALITEKKNREEVLKILAKYLG